MAALALAAGLLGCQAVQMQPMQQPGQDFALGRPGLRVRKPVETFRQQRFRDVVPQRLDYSCGAAALATLLRFYYEDPVEETEIIVEMLQSGDADRIRREGFALLDLKHFAEKRGYQTRGFRIGPGVLERLAIPAITLLETRGYKHFVVLKGVRGGMAYLADPALGQRRMSKDEFLEEWQGVVFFVAAHRDESALAPLEKLETNPAPTNMVRQLGELGLRTLHFERGEF